MEFETQAPLLSYNSLHFEAQARKLCHARSEEDLREALERARSDNLRLFILGGGSNVVIAGDLDGLVLRVETRGVDVLEESGNGVLLQVAAGEDWPQLVLSCLELGFFGLENLSDIPGTAGAAPIQNIGAYGVELSHRIHSVQVMEIDSGRALDLPAEDCGFSYRRSHFKSAWQGRYLVTGIRLKLSTVPRLCLDYAGISDELEAMGCKQPEPGDVAKAVSNLRARKLPDPTELGNAGSFFTNPTVDAGQAEALAQEHPGLPSYPADDGRVKLAAGWMVERCGYKGMRRGCVGVSKLQALVLVHHGGGQASDLLALAAEIQNAVQRRFGVALDMEPRVLQ